MKYQLTLHQLTLLSCLLALTALSFDAPPGSLIGRWQQNFSGGTAVTVFRADETFDISVNGKTFVSGRYRVKGDTLAISDPVCGVGYYGTYGLTFLTPDSIRQTLIEDTCRVRRQSIQRAPINGRAKPTKP